MLEDEEEVLLALAESLPTLLDIIGTGNLLLAPLEKLCYVEDVTVRDKVNDHFLPLSLNLAISGCGWVQKGSY